MTYREALDMCATMRKLALDEQQQQPQPQQPQPQQPHLAPKPLQQAPQPPQLNSVKLPNNA